LCSVHDAIELERRGIPATVIVSRAFRETAAFQFRARGMAGHPWVELPHPISTLDPGAMRALTLDHLDEVVRQLTG